MVDYRAEISAYLEHEIDTIRKLDVEQINQALNLLLEAFEGETRYTYSATEEARQRRRTIRTISTRACRSTQRRNLISSV